MMMEMMGLHLPGAAFVNPNTPLRDALTGGRDAAGGRDHARRQRLHADRRGRRREGIVNGVAGLLATGGSTNHTLHLVAMARAAGMQLTWEDFDDLSRVAPLIARVYPNGSEDVNDFHAAGGMAFVIRQLLDAGLLHEDVLTVAGAAGCAATRRAVPRRTASWSGATALRQRSNADILRPADDPFQRRGRPAAARRARSAAR